MDVAARDAGVVSGYWFSVRTRRTWRSLGAAEVRTSVGCCRDHCVCRRRCRESRPRCDARGLCVPSSPQIQPADDELVSGSASREAEWAYASWTDDLAETQPDRICQAALAAMGTVV